MIINHPINLTKGPSVKNFDYKKNTVNNILNPYFNSVVINERRTKGKQFIRCSYVPFIALFTNKKYREMYLDFTKESTERNTIRLREILCDDISRKNHYVLMVEKIGDTLNAYGLDTFQITTIEYTDDNRHNDGARKKYYLNVKGIKNEEKDVKDLSELYFRIKELRARTKKDKTLSKNA